MNMKLIGILRQIYYNIDYSHVQILVLHPPRRFESHETRKSESKGAFDFDSNDHMYSIVI